VCRIDRDVVLEELPESFVLRANDSLRSRPEQTVMNDEEVRSGFHGAVDHAL
jgi:hypothetical protein